MAKQSRNNRRKPHLYRLSRRRKLSFERLENRRLLAGDISLEAMEFIYELNVARSDPAAYSQAAGLSDSLSGVQAQPPLAVNDQLEDSSLFHATEMADNNYFAHQSAVTGDHPNQMAVDAGYALNSSFPLDQNFIESLAAGTNLTDANDVLRLLIEDENVDPPGHRYHLLATGPSQSFWENHVEIGVGHAYNANATYRNYWAIHTAYKDQSETFLTGVVYADLNNNDSYDAGEGLSGVTVNVEGTLVTTNNAGGWSLSVVPGEYNISASGGDFSGLSSTVAVVAGANVEVDFISGEVDGYVNFVATQGDPPLDPPPADWLRTQRDLGAVDQGVAARDLASGIGYIMHSLEEVHERFSDVPPAIGNSTHLVAVVHQNGQWHYDNDQVLTPFRPVATDTLLARVDFSEDTITPLVEETVTEGIATGYGSGDLQFVADQWGANPDDGEFRVTGTHFDALSAVDRFDVGVLNFGVAADDSATGAGYVLYSESTLQLRFPHISFPAGSSEQLGIVRYDSGQWSLDVDGTLIPFNPRPSDLLLAEVDYTNDTISSYSGFAGQIHGVRAGFAAGDMTFDANMWNGATDNGEFQIGGTWFDAPRPATASFSVGELGDGVQARDGATGVGFLMYSWQNLYARFVIDPLPSGGSDHFVVVVHSDGQWFYDNNDELVPFTPASGDVLIADIDFSADSIQPISTLGQHHGIASGYIDGDLTFQANSLGGLENLGEFEVSGTSFERLWPASTVRFDAGVIASGIGADDLAQGSGYIFYSARPLHQRFDGVLVDNSAHFGVATYADGQWALDNNGAHVPFDPEPGDVLLAEVDFLNDVITPLQGALGSRHGFQSGFLRGDVQFTANQFNGLSNLGEFDVTGSYFVAPSPTTRFEIGDVHLGMAVRDNATGPAHVMYSEESAFDRFADSPPLNGSSEHLVVVMYIDGQWHYDNNGQAVPFTPRETDTIIADVDLTGDTIVGLGGTLADRHGIRAGYLEGDLTFLADYWGNAANDGEFKVEGSYFRALSRNQVAFEVGPLNSGINIRGNATGTASVMFSPEALPLRFPETSFPAGASDHLVAVVHANGQWHYDDGTQLVPFVPTSADVLLAELDVVNANVTDYYDRFGELHGIKHGYAGGNLAFHANQYGGSPLPGKFEVTGSFFLRHGSDTDRVDLARPGALGAGVTAIDNASGTGYMMFSQQPLSSRFTAPAGNSEHFIVVVHQNGQWHYDNNDQLILFQPRPSDLLVAELDFDTNDVTTLDDRLGEINGIRSGYLDGDLTIVANQYGGQANDGEYTVAGTEFKRLRPLQDILQIDIGHVGDGVAADDTATGTAYLLRSRQSLTDRFGNLSAGSSEHFVVVVFTQGQWHIDNNGAMQPFTPRTDDLIVADIDYGSDAVTMLQGVQSSRHGIEAGYIDGDLAVASDQYGGEANAGEFEVSGSYLQRFVVSSDRMWDETTSSIAAHDTATGAAYLLYSEQSLNDRFASAPLVAGSSSHFVVVTHAGGQWHYDNNGASHPFTPRESDVIVADIDYTNDVVTPRQGQLSVIHGVFAGYGEGDLQFQANMYGGQPNAGEFQVEGTYFRTAEIDRSGDVSIGDLASGVAADDTRSGTGYLMYTELPVVSRFGSATAGAAEHLAAVLHVNGQWFYDNNGGLSAFTPSPSDVLLAEFQYGGDTVTSLIGAVGEFEGIRRGYRDGDLVFLANRFGGEENFGEFEVTGTYFHR